MISKKIHLVSANSDNINGMEYFVSKAFKNMGYDVIETDYRVMNKFEVSTRIRYITDVEFLLVIKGDRVCPEDIFACRVPTVLWLQDSVQANQEANFVIQTKSSLFDIVFGFANAELPFYKQFNKNSYWLPLACDPDIHKSIENKNKLIDVGFIGNLNNNRINMIMSLLDKGIPVQYNYSMNKYAEVVGNTKINLNVGITDAGYQMRIFEILSMGGLLFTNKVIDENLFRDKGHLIYYENFDQLANLCYDFIDEDYISNRIAKEGQKEVLEKHTYKHRVKEIIDKVNNL